MGSVTAKLCRLAIWHRGILIGSQGQGCPSNEPWRTRRGVPGRLRHQINRARGAHHHGEEIRCQRSTKGDVLALFPQQYLDF